MGGTTGGWRLATQLEGLGELQVLSIFLVWRVEFDRKKELQVVTEFDQCANPRPRALFRAELGLRF